MLPLMLVFRPQLAPWLLVGALCLVGACTSRAPNRAGAGSGGEMAGGAAGISGGSGGLGGQTDGATGSDRGAADVDGMSGGDRSPDAGGAPDGSPVLDDAGAPDHANQTDAVAAGDAITPPDGAAPIDAPARDTAPAADAGASGTIVSMLDVGDVWSGHPVGFALLTRGNQQFVAFYDAQRQMTIGQRALDGGGSAWTFARVPSMLGWDSHNYIAMAIDGGGFIHVAGNMHSSPLVYFRTTRPLDVSTFQRVDAMVAMNEQSCTYPQFIAGPSGEFVFAYRDGVSGNGNYIFNVYDPTTQTWRRLINSPLTDGQGLRNAYPVGPTLGPDGWWHLVYVWRETADAGSNHDLSYAKSRDLVSWQSGTGRPLALPITLATSDIVDAVPQNGGMINNNTKVGFDSQNRPVIGYHKYDAAGNTQLYNARVEGGRWVSHRTSSWNYRWVVAGTGTLVFQIQLDGVGVAPDGTLKQVWYHMQLGGWNAFQLDETTLAAVATLGRSLPYPASLERAQSTTAGMGVRWASDSGTSPDAAITYMLRWETLAENQDQPRATIPPPTRLRLYGFRK